MLMFPGELKRILYFVSDIRIQVEIFNTRWNAAVGCRLFSRRFYGLEALLMTGLLLVLPFIILIIITGVLSLWSRSDMPHAA
jgi:hypothetical protein